MAKSKIFLLSPEEIHKLAPNRGGCIATDRIMVDGMPVGFMYREEPHNSRDSGWRILAGDETSEYMSDSNNHDVNDVNTIANYDQDIIPFLDLPIGTELERPVGEAVLRPLRQH